MDYARIWIVITYFARDKEPCRCDPVVTVFVNNIVLNHIYEKMKIYKYAEIKYLVFFTPEQSISDYQSARWPDANVSCKDVQFFLGCI